MLEIIYTLSRLIIYLVGLDEFTEFKLRLTKIAQIFWLKRKVEIRIETYTSLNCRQPISRRKI